MPSHEDVWEVLQGLRRQKEDLSNARKNMTKIIKKQEAQKEILGMPLLTADFNKTEKTEHDLS